MEFFEVGGCNRDDLMGIPSKDVDFAISGCNSFAEMWRELEDQGFEIFDHNEEFLTIRAKVPATRSELLARTKVADFVMCRKDSAESDGRRPNSVTPGTIIDDLARRDFTVNAIARNSLTGEIIDPFNGVEDIRRGILRFVGEPEQRIAEDGLRVLRGFRFKITRNLLPEGRTEMALFSDFAAEMLLRVSLERIREELNKMFAADTIAALELISSMSDQMIAAIFRDGLKLQSTLKGK